MGMARLFKVGIPTQPNCFIFRIDIIIVISYVFSQYENHIIIKYTFKITLLEDIQELDVIINSEP